MGGYELQDHLSEQFFRPAGGYFANFSSSVGSTSEEIYSQQAVYFSTSDGRSTVAVYFSYRWRLEARIRQGQAKFSLILVFENCGLPPETFPETF